MATDRWFLSGPLGIGTAFDEATDANTALGVKWADVGTAVRHGGGDALNVLDARAAAVNQGPQLNLWGLNAGSKATRLGLITSRFASTTDGGASSYMAFHTKAAGRDVSEALRITGTGDVGIGTVDPKARLHVGGDTLMNGGLTVGSGGHASLKVRHIDGKHWENDTHDALYLNWKTGKGVVIGDAVVQSSLQVYGHTTLTNGDLRLDPHRTIVAAGRLNIGGDELLLVLNKSGLTVGKAWGGNGNLHVEGFVGIGTGAPEVKLDIRGGDIRMDGGATLSARGRLHIAGDETLYVLNRNGVIFSKAWGGTGDVVIEGRLGIGYPATPRNPYWGGGLRCWDVEAEGSIWTGADLYVEHHTYLNGNLRVRGSKSGVVVDDFVNALGDTLERGDVVVVSESQNLRYTGLNGSIPVPEVDLASRAYDTRVCGIVSELAEPEKGQEAVRVGPGQTGSMVTLGAFAYCKVDADLGAIEVGDLLTTSPTRGHAQKVLDRQQASGAILGKALGPLKQGRGLIPILVTLH